MRRFVLVALSLSSAMAVSRPISAQVEAWRAQHDSGTFDPASSFDNYTFLFGPSQPAALGADGAHYAMLSVESFGSVDTALVRHDSEGELSWVRWLESGYYFVGAVGVDDAGDVYITHRDECSYLRKLDSAGNVLWTSRLTGSDTCKFHFRALAVVGDAVYVLGEEQDYEKLLVARIGTDGVLAWSYTRSVDPVGAIGARGMAVDDQGTVVVAATLRESEDSAHWLVMKIASDGQPSWERSFDYGGYLDVPTSIALGPDGRVTVAGVSNGEETMGVVTIQWDSSGVELWRDRVESGVYYGGWIPESTIALDSTGNVILATVGGRYETSELLLFEYGPDGARHLLDQRPVPGGALGSLLLDEADRIYVAASVADGAEGRQVEVLAFEADGTLRWQEVVASPIPISLGELLGREGRLVLTATELSYDELQGVVDPLWIGLDLDGNRTWEAGEPLKGSTDVYCGPSYNARDALNRSGSCLAIGPDGSVQLAGTVILGNGYTPFELRTLKLDAKGSVAWTRAYRSPGTENLYNQVATALTVDSSGAARVAGYGWQTLKYDAVGDREWARPRLTGRDVVAVGADSTGAAYVLGVASPVSSASRMAGPSPSPAIFLQKYTAEGDESWSRSFYGPGNRANSPSALLVTTEDRIVYVGQFSASTGYQAVVNAYDADGNSLFSRTFDSVGSDASLEALATDDGATVAVGRAKSASGFDALVVRLDASGNVSWRRDIDGDVESGDDDNGDDEATAVAVDLDGNAYVAGRTWNGEDFDVLVVKLDPAGTELWRRAIDLGHGDDEAWSAAFDGPGPGKTAGSLWIAGRASNGSDTDALTLRLDTEGAELFRHLVAGTEERNDEHYDLVIGPVPGHATVAGVSAEVDESYNFQAIRYVTSPLDVDYDGEAGALSDGLLIQRWLFGFRGSVLETGAVDQALCVRCPAEQIDLHLSAIVKLLDVDGDGAAESLTDGALVFRWLFGFRGAALVAGAVDLAHCTRCDAAAIEAHLEGLAE